MPNKTRAQRAAAKRRRNNGAFAPEIIQHNTVHNEQEQEQRQMKPLIFIYEDADSLLEAEKNKRTRGPYKKKVVLQNTSNTQSTPLVEEHAAQNNNDDTNGEYQSNNKTDLIQ